MGTFHFYVTTLALFVSALLLAETPVRAQQTKGNGDIQTQTREASDFTGIDVSGGFAVEITQGKNEEVRLEAEENLMSQITTEVKNGVLHIYTTGNIMTSKGMKAFITIKELESIEISGGVRVKGNSTFKTSTLKLDLSGGSKITLAMQVKTLRAEMSGAAKAALSGRADNVELDVAGASRINAEELEAKHVKVEASGAGKVNVFAKETLEIEASGAARIGYKGSPGITSETSAAASVSEL